MSKSEMRFLRREIIADLLRDGWGDIICLRLRVRAFEVWYYAQELQAYKQVNMYKLTCKKSNNALITITVKADSISKAVWIVSKLGYTVVTQKQYT